MDAPQSREDVDRIERQLQALDAGLTIRWNPRARVVRVGRYDCYGHLIPPEYEGRWEIWRHALDGQEQRIWVVTEQDSSDGEYRPIDDRLVTDMRQWDAANVHAFEDLRKRLWAEHDARHPDHALPEFVDTLSETWDQLHGGRTQWTGADLSPET